MKKFVSLMVVFIFTICMVACGDNKSNRNNTKATIITNEGESIEMTAAELIDIYDSNEAKFDKLYYGAKITFEGTVKSVKTDCLAISEKGCVSGGFNKIVFEEGWCLALGENDSAAVDLEELDKDEKNNNNNSNIGSTI